MKSELKKILRARAHALKPVVIVGQHGLTQAVLDEVDLALEHHELIKVRVNAADREERKALTDALRAGASAELIQSIGHVVTLYRKNPDGQSAKPRR